MKNPALAVIACCCASLRGTKQSRLIKAVSTSVAVRPFYLDYFVPRNDLYLAAEMKYLLPFYSISLANILSLSQKKSNIS
jgi:hypothetical protein